MKVLGGEGREKTREASWNERGKKKRLRIVGSTIRCLPGVYQGAWLTVAEVKGRLICLTNRDRALIV